MKNEKNHGASLAEVVSAGSIAPDAAPHAAPYEDDIEYRLTRLGRIMVDSKVMNSGVVRAVASATLRLVRSRMEKYGEAQYALAELDDLLSEMEAES